MRRVRMPEVSSFPPAGAAPTLQAPYPVKGNSRAALAFAVALLAAPTLPELVPVQVGSVS